MGRLENDADQDLRYFAWSALLAIARDVPVEEVKAMYTTRHESSAGNGPQRSVAAIMGGLAASNRGEAAEAMAAADEAVQLDPTNPAAWFWRGRFLAEQGRPLEAIHDMEHSLALEPDDGWRAKLEDLRRQIRN